MAPTKDIAHGKEQNGQIKPLMGRHKMHDEGIGCMMRRITVLEVINGSVEEYWKAPTKIYTLFACSHATEPRLIGFYGVVPRKLIPQKNLPSVFPVYVSVLELPKAPSKKAEVSKNLRTRISAQIAFQKVFPLACDGMLMEMTSLSIIKPQSERIFHLQLGN
ncbi:predicted protein [Sclerotinia sclerotiorum 1980 UF-70]|uniref:Uncharacterized protein n=1 Tax=Sclerotinia sclerotiorum (strain ATCC 18683 / 1980 / Ss-1) TaxID=665079 RepID=A7F6F9_SCLS1|nr:predicted protein [Sclerotinia sclerotiorum 1980 UF-70]EDN98330.1 predicted protein [Sclerotinia sclerotiorum 1980 UF-70]